MYITMTTPDEVYINHFEIARNILKGIDFDQALSDFLSGQYDADLAYFIEESLTYAEKEKIKEEVTKEIKHLKKDFKMYQITYSFPSIEKIFAPDEGAAIDIFKRTFPLCTIENIKEIKTRVENIDESTIF